MTDIVLCPACLTELSPDYALDHVAVDRALAGDRALFVALDRSHRSEVVVTGLARGITLLDLTKRLSWPYNQLQALLPDGHPESPVSQRIQVERLIRDLWEQDLLDVTIAARTGLNPSKIGRIRKRLGLPPRSKRSAHWKAVPA